MNLNQVERERLALRSQTLQERIEEPLFQSGSNDRKTSTSDLYERFENWKDSFTNVGTNAFQRRLSREGITTKDAEERLTMQTWPKEKEIPGWIATIEDILSYINSCSKRHTNLDSSIQKNTPFIHLLQKIVDFSSKSMATGTTKKIKNLFTESAWNDMENWLLTQLDSLYSQVLFIEYKVYKERLKSGGLNEESVDSNRVDGYYRGFIRDLIQGGLKDLFLEYSVLARLTVVVIRQWMEAVQEFILRLSDDKELIRFANCSNQDRISKVDVLGDHHDEGRAVLGVYFSTGSKVVYKPRQIAAELEFSKFIGWINEKADFCDLQTPNYIDQGEYGWVEWIDTEDCTSYNEIEKYYTNAGRILSVLYILNFTDGNIENILASKTQPIIVDTETIIQPSLSIKKLLTDDPSRQIIRNSVLHTSILPIDIGEVGFAEAGGLVQEKATMTGVKEPLFKDVNSDRMEMYFQSEHEIEGDNLPHLHGKARRPEEFCDCILAGFEEMYRFFIKHRSALLSKEGPLSGFFGVECRLIYRSTYFYAKFLSALTNPTHLKSGVSYGYVLEELVKPLVTGRVDDSMWPLVNAERRALWRLDFPRITYRTNSHELSSTTMDDERLLSGSPISILRKKILGLSEDDLQEQLDYITLAYKPERIISQNCSIEEPESGKERSASNTNQEGIRISGDVLDSANHVSDRLYWFLRTNRTREGVSVEKISESLYTGELGIELFLAAINCVSEEESNREVAPSAKPDVGKIITNDIVALSPNSGRELNTASYIYALCKKHEFLDDDRYLAAAQRAAERLTEEAIYTDQDLSVSEGSAGVVLGLLALYEQTNDQRVLDRTRVAGDHIVLSLNQAKKVGSQSKRGKNALADGFAHGRDGIVYALLRLHDVTGSQHFKQAAVDLLDSEDLPECSNSEVQSTSSATAVEQTNPIFPTDNHGTGLANVAIYDLIDDETIESNIRCIAQDIESKSLLYKDDIFQGNAGRIEFLLEAGRSLDDPSLTEQAQHLASRMVNRAYNTNGYSVPWQTEHWTNPTFILGISGIGYTLLRLGNPELPCILVWE